MKPPKALNRPTQTHHHGRIRHDPYAWLKSNEWQDIFQNPQKLPPDIRQYLEAENQYTNHILQPANTLQQTLLTEMKNRLPQEDHSVPLTDGNTLYWQEYAANQEYPSFFRKHNGKTSLLLNANQQAAHHNFFKLGHLQHHPNHQLFAWSADLTGGEFYTLHIRNTQNGKDIDQLHQCDGHFIWAGDHIIYVKLNQQHRPFAVLRHKIATPQAQDQLIYQENNPAFFLSVNLSLSRDYAFIHSYDHDSSEVRLILTQQPHQPAKLVRARQKGVEYQLAHDKQNKQFFILTNQNAINFKIMVTHETQPNQWRDLIPHQPSVYIVDMIAFHNHLIRLERKNGLPRLIIRHLRNETETEKNFGNTPHHLSIEEGFEYQTQQLRLYYSSMQQADQVFDLDLNTQTLTLRKTKKISGGYNTDNYICERHLAPTADGELVPISLLFHKNTPPSPASPLWLYGYGAYGISIPPAFSPHRLSLVNRGWVFAIAHIRGGSDKGRQWYQQGKLQHKHNSFSDFITCAQHLIHIGYTSAGRITAQGGSAGGMLMGTVANQAPHLFQTIIAQVPFVDVLATMLDADLPLTPPEWLEWGNPITDPNAYDRIAAYSPYDNVREQNYPAILATAGLTDPRVGYWEAAKWIARVRHAQQAPNPICLKTEMQAGHAGKAGRFQSLEEIAAVYAFAMLVSQ